MSHSAEEIAREFKALMDRYGGKYPNWYVGVAEDAREKLDQEHNFDTSAGDVGIFLTAASELQANKVVKFFVGKYRCKGNTKSMDIGALEVYAYYMQPHTIP